MRKYVVLAVILLITLGVVIMSGVEANNCYETAPSSDTKELSDMVDVAEYCYANIDENTRIFSKIGFTGTYFVARTLESGGVIGLLFIAIVIFLFLWWNYYLIRRWMWRRKNTP